MKTVGVFDAHFHVIDPTFPLVPNQGYLPDAFTCDDYLVRCDQLGITPRGGAVVSGSFQAFDQSYLIHALARLGEHFFGVTQLPASTPDAEILELHSHGVRALRFNLFRGGSETLNHLESFASRVYELAGWHIELYVDSAQLDALHSRLARLPRICVDHLGLSEAGFPALLKLAEKGAYVKATGFSRGDLDIPAAMTKLCAANPESLLFGTDLPCTRAPRVFSKQDLLTLQDTLQQDQYENVMYRNAARLYGAA